MPAESWRFSLSDSFRAITVCAVAVVASVQLGPLAGIRDLGIALGIGCLVLAWRQRSKRFALAAGAVMLLGFVPTILAAGAPFSRRDAVCLECGKSRHTHEVCGWMMKDEIWDNECSRWAAPRVSNNHVHRWRVTSHYGRNEWFGNAPIACGLFPEGATLAWQFTRFGQPLKAEQVHQEYLDIMHGRSRKPVTQHAQEATAALETARCSYVP